VVHTPSDIDLMLGCQKGDDEAFDQLVLRHQRPVLNLVRRFVGPIPDVEDLAQDVFVRLYQARASYRPTAKFTTFLYRNTLNLCLNYIRDRKHRRAVSLESGGEEDGYRFEPPDEAAESPPAAVARREASEAVRRAVAELPENQRSAVILSRWQGLPYLEIAETMELTVMAVKSLLSRAKENLRYKLSVVLKDEERIREAREGETYE
jgi:RNA polymerase sigma-70 factor (ECF subfamily)